MYVHVDVIIDISMGPGRLHDRLPLVYNSLSEKASVLSKCTLSANQRTTVTSAVALAHVVA